MNNENKKPAGFGYGTFGKATEEKQASQPFGKPVEPENQDPSKPVTAN